MARSRLDSSSVDFAFMGDPVEPTSGPPMWSFISFPAILFCATVAGGILAVRLRPPVCALVIVAMNTILLHVGGNIWNRSIGFARYWKKSRPGLRTSEDLLYQKPSLQEYNLSRQ